MLRGGRTGSFASQALALSGGRARGFSWSSSARSWSCREFPPSPLRAAAGAGAAAASGGYPAPGPAEPCPEPGSPRGAAPGEEPCGLGRVQRTGTAGARTGLQVTNKKPTQASITKVKQFEGSTSFVRRSQWMLEQLRQVNGIDPNRDSAEFDLLFENAFDQWVASTASEKCTFFQILHHTCQRYLTDRKPEFINCQSKIMGGNSILHSAADSVTSAVQKASQALNERGERLGRAEEKTEDMKNSAQQFAETAHKLAMKHKC
ncbi:syntaxin-binding protein 6 isoform X2 [Mesoplodon densirostris]|uniref:syntaxin-binding protein 6 isoform X2 n=1 Tax=Mesoplodon densirostris TaxID=48708 RepID=UPI0028DBDA96|nr:syntaxin-binding protein 6 isoform X2 [Mesoplodon densirostris]